MALGDKVVTLDGLKAVNDHVQGQVSGLVEAVGATTGYRPENLFTAAVQYTTDGTTKNISNSKVNVSVSGDVITYTPTGNDSRFGSTTTAGGNFYTQNANWYAGYPIPCAGMKQLLFVISNAEGVFKKNYVTFYNQEGTSLGASDKIAAQVFTRPVPEGAAFATLRIGSDTAVSGTAYTLTVGCYGLADSAPYSLNEMIEELDAKTTAADEAIRTDMVNVTGNLAAGWKQAQGLYLSTGGALTALTSGRTERTICVKGKPNTAYTIKKDTATVMRAGCGASDALTAGSQLTGYADTAGGEVRVTTGETDIYIYIQLFADSDAAELQSIEANLGSLRVTETARAVGGAVNVLLVGNSYTLDEFAYVPALLKEMAPDLAFHFCVLYHGSGGLSHHVTHMTEDTAYANCYEYSDADRAWTSASSVKLSDVIGKYPYDIVVFNEASAVTVFDDSKANLKTLIDGYSARIGRPVSFVWQLSHARLGDGYAGYAEKALMAQRAMAESGISDVFVSGTAVANAGTTALDALGDSGHMRYDAESHLQEGLPCLVPAYANALKLMELVGRKKTGVYGSQIRPKQAWTEAQGSPQQHGTSVGVSDANCLLAAKCAAAAIKKPFEVTDCSEM